MKMKFLLSGFLLFILFPVVCTADEYELREWTMREVAPVEAADNDSADIDRFYFLVSAPVSDREFVTTFYDYPDSVLIHDFGWLSTYHKMSDTLRLKSIQNRLMRISPALGCDSALTSQMSHLGHLEVAAIAEEPGKDSVEVKLSLGRFPKGRATLVIDDDTIPSLRIVDNYLTTTITDSLTGGTVWSRQIRGFYSGDNVFPIVREITECLKEGADSIVLPTITLLASQEAVEEVIAESVTSPGKPEGGSGHNTLEAEILSPDEISVTFSSDPEDTDVEIRVYDVLGHQLLAPRKIDVREAGRQLRLRMASPLPGVFFVSVVSRLGTETIKIVR